MNVIFLITLLSLISSNKAGNVLILSGIPSPSHYIYNRALAEGLANRGHNITFLSPDVSKNKPENFHYIHLENVYSHYYNGSEHIDLMEMSKQGPLENLFSFYDFGAFMCEGIAKSVKALAEINSYPSNFKFDLVIHDYTCGPCLLGFLPKFNYPPLVGLSAFNNPPYTVDIVGGDKLGLTAKPFYLLNYDNKMNIFQRFNNAFFNFMDSFYRKFFAMPAIDNQMKKLFGTNSPSADDLDKLHTIMLVNSNPAIDFAESLPPNIIQVGGMQIKEAKPLPKDINDFIMKGKKGAVVMGLGTNMRSDEIGPVAINSIIESFRQLPDYNFIWKFETKEMLKNIPSNLLVKDWLPQNDILAHPNIKAFITHGGLLSTHEALWHGVPMVVIPFIADQHRNSHRIVSAGIGVKVNFQTITAEKLTKALVELLHSPKFRKNIQLKSKRFRDQPEKPLDRAMWWCEYVMRNPKPNHLRQPTFNLGLLGSHFWDVQVIMILIAIVAFCIVRKLFKLTFSDKNNKIGPEKKNN